MRQIAVDVTILARNDYETGIQRVVRALVLSLLHETPAGWCVEPVILSDKAGVWHFRHARKWTRKLLGLPHDRHAGDGPVAFQAGDVLLGADFIGGLAVEAEKSGVYRSLRHMGVDLYFIVYDLLPLQMPHVFPPGAFGFEAWVNTVVRSADGVLCISESVARDVKRFVEDKAEARDGPLHVGFFHLGGDLENSRPSRGRPPDAAMLLDSIACRPSFLMVGTIEPRKGHMQSLDAFDALWADGEDVNLVVVGREGWKGLPETMRRNIPEMVKRLSSHPMAGSRLFWLDDCSDEFLEDVYSASSCLLAASEGEGFGLPLAEAARRNVPILARDIPVFREVGGSSVTYFSAGTAGELADAVRAWLRDWQEGRVPASGDMPITTWADSARNVLSQIIR